MIKLTRSHPKLLAGNAHPNTALNSQQSTIMINGAAKAPAIRMAEIKATRASQEYETNETLKEWGIQVSSKMTELKGRVIPPPRVEYQSAPPRVDAG